MGQQEFDRTRFIVRKLWELKLQIYMIEKEGTQLSDGIGNVIMLMMNLYAEGIITRSFFVELEYMFDALGFLWIHHDSPPYLLYLLEKLVDELSDNRVRPPRSITAATAL